MNTIKSIGVSAKDKDIQEVLDEIANKYLDTEGDNLVYGKLDDSQFVAKVDKANRFVSVFSPISGFYARSGVYDDKHKDTGVDPFMSSFPELIDVGIMQRCVCSKFCNVDCYQKACDRIGDNMSLENYESILKQMKGKTFQCLDEEEVVLVRSQFGNVSSKYIKDVRVGDYIFYKDNQFVRVTDKREKLSDAFKIKLTYGKSIIATEEHKFPTTNGLKTVSQLNLGDELTNIKESFKVDNIRTLDLVKLIIDLGLEDRFYLTDCPGMKEVCKKYDIKRNTKKTVKILNIKNYLSEIDYSNAKINRERSKYQFYTTYKITPDLMILLGHFVGNGSHRTYVVNKEQVKMIDAIENALRNVFPSFTYKKKINDSVCKIELDSGILHDELFSKIFECRTITGEKQLPNFIYNVSRDLKIKFLKGYFCDGNFRIQTKDGHYGDITFNTSSKKLAKDVELLLATMNVDYSTRSYEGGQEPFSKNDNRIINRKTRYRIYVNNLLELNKVSEVVDDHRNANKFNDMINDYHDSKYLRVRQGYIIQDIKRLDGQRRVIDINVDSEEHLFMTSNGIISHNCALGGAGDVDTHENFEDILRITREYGIVPNFTSSGIAMTKEKAEICKRYTGGVAVSMHFADYTYKAIQMLLDAGVETNIHYVLSNNSIDTAIDWLKNDKFPKGIHAVVWLLYKDVGLGKTENVLKVDDPRVKEFFELIDTKKYDFNHGFDSCSIAGLINFTSNINPDSIDTCESARWSAYITSDMKMLPCSFDNQDLKWAVDLNTYTIQEAWDSDVFEDFRSHFRNSCKGCKDRENCRGGCVIRRNIVLCDRKEKDLQ